MPLKMNCHPDRSEPGFPATQHRRPRVHLSVKKGAGNRRSHQTQQEIRGSEVEGPAVHSTRMRYQPKHHATLCYPEWTPAFRSTQGDEKYLLSNNRSPGKLL